MKVLFLNATGQLGGAERVLISLLKALRSARPDWALEVLAGDEGPLIPLLSELGFSVRVLPMPSRLIKMGEASSANPVALILSAAAFLREKAAAFSFHARDHRLGGRSTNSSSNPLMELFVESVTVIVWIPGVARVTWTV